MPRETIYDYVFVYGTLKVGEFFSKVWPQFSSLMKSHRPALIKGAELYQLDYPAIIPVEDQERVVHGEVHEYNSMEYVISLMDGIEQFNEREPNKSFYIRKVVEIFPEDGSHSVIGYAYYINPIIFHAYESADKAEPILSGIWEG